MKSLIEKRIYDIIENIVCKSCGQKCTETCQKHRKRCTDMYKMEAKEIYENIVKPLEAN